ncbi:acyl-CoA dehydrogenase, partial [Komagataeibacter melaceti]
AAMVRGRAVEQVMRDLATYLRQPAPDETLTEAAAWFVDHEWPGMDA